MKLLIQLVEFFTNFILILIKKVKIETEKLKKIMWLNI